MEAQYQYEALDLSRPSLRVLQVKPSSNDDEIECILRNATVEPVSYIALSYMWHPDKAQKNEGLHRVLLNGVPFPVTENLWNFLNSARKEYAETDFWIDAICINQKHHAERNHQVGQMHRIYSNAFSVLVWLGEGDNTTHRFFDFVNDGSWGSSFLPRSMRILDPSGFKITEPEPEEDRLLRDVALKLIRNPYWRRSWIVQELLLAKRIEIMMGADRIAWSSFFGAMDIQEHAGSIESQAGGQRMAHVRLAKDNPDGMTAPSSLEGLIVYFSDQECSDPRDRVYSMLGIADERDHFDVDYDCTTAQVIEYTLQKINLENLLSTPKIVESLGLPSLEVSSGLSATFLNSEFGGDRFAHSM